MAFELPAELKQRVADLKLGISNAPSEYVNNKRLHLLDLFKVIDDQAAEIERLDGVVASLQPKPQSPPAPAPKPDKT